MAIRASILAAATLAFGPVACWTACGADSAVARGLALRTPGLLFAEPRYEAVRDGSLVTLTDRVSETTVTIAPSVGNIATAFRVKGHNGLRFPHASLAQFEARPAATGIPFMAPWANRLDEPAFYANGRRHPFDMTLGNIRGDLAAISNALNMAHRGEYSELQSIAPGQTWRESFWLKPTGF